MKGKKISFSFTPGELAEMKRIIEKQIPGTAFRAEGTTCPACNALMDDARSQYCPSCGQRLNWVSIAQDSKTITSIPYVKTPSDVLDLIEAQSFEITVATNRLINHFAHSMPSLKQARRNYAKWRG